MKKHIAAIFRGIAAFFGWLWELNEIAVDYLAGWLSWVARGSLLVFLLALGIAGAVKVALATRNSSGTNSRPAGTPYTTHTQISSATVNSEFADVSAELTNSLDRSGRGGMTAPLRGTDAAKTAPAFSFTNEPGSGVYRAGTNDLRMSINSIDKVFWSATGEGIGVAPAWPLHVQGGTSGATQARFGASADTPLIIYTSTTQPTITGNATNDGSTGWKYATSSGAQSFNLDATGSGFIFYTAPSGTAGNAVTFTQRASITPTGLNIGTGVAADGSGFKHKRVAGCTTAASTGAVCTTTVTWGTAFADASYTVSCMGVTPSNQPEPVGASSQTAAAVAFDTRATAASAASYTTIDCIAVHD